MTARFSPQPYPLYAVPLEPVAEPARFQLTIDPVRLVLGWVTDDEGTTLPALAGGSPGGTPWDGPVFFEETYEAAYETSRRIDKADRATVRDAKMQAFFTRVDAHLTAYTQEINDRLDRVSKR